MPAAIEVRQLGKKYQLGLPSPKRDGIRRFLRRSFPHTPPDLGTDPSANCDPNSLWALRDVDFDVTAGEILGVIGRNGAGKSTLLKIISRITEPTEGQVTVRGHLAALLEVGTGFHPELTGRENIFLNGAILGMKKAEIEAKFGSIVAFSEMDQYLDTPVKHYSTGMHVRLAFAVAAHLDPEILMIDEVLAVGDLPFQKKCLGKMSEVNQGGRTVVFVSHQMAMVESLCQRVIVLDHGRLVFEGEAKEAIHYYNRMVAGGAKTGSGNSINLSQRRGGIVKPALLERLELLTNDQPANCGLPLGARFKIRIQFNLEMASSQVDVGIGFDNLFGQRILTLHTRFDPHCPCPQRSGRQVLVCDIPSFTLVPGEYKLTIWLELEGTSIDVVENAATIDVLDADYYGTGRVPWNGLFVLEQHWYLECP
jgi:lipopolysaccharide transport system ATP-binding protein